MRKDTPKKGIVAVNKRGRSLPSAMEWRPIFLATLRATGNIRLSCHQAGIGRKTAYIAKEKSAEFQSQWEEALNDAVDVLEGEARKRALETSDTLLIFLLKAHRPELYRETHHLRHSGPDGGPIQLTKEKIIFTLKFDNPNDDENADLAVYETPSNGYQHIALNGSEEGT